MNVAPGRDAYLGYIPVTQIRDETPFRFRRPNDGAIERVRASLFRFGQSHPLLLEERADGTFVILDGHRRVAAVRRIIENGGHWDKMLAHVVHRPTPPLVLRWLIHRNTGTTPFGPTERGALLAWAAAMGLEKRTIAREAGLTIPEVEDALELAEAPEEVGRLIDESQLDPLYAVMLLRRYLMWTQTRNGPLALDTVARIIAHARTAPVTLKGWRFLLDFYWSDERPFMVESRARPTC